MAFFDFLKRKEGGTVVGNILRGVVNNISGGLLGNGALMLKPGQSAQENNQAAIAAAAAGAQAFKDYKGEGGDNADDSIKLGAVKQWIKNNALYIVAGLAGVYLLIKNLKK